MTEIKLLTKIALVVDAIIWILFGTMFIFLYDMFLNPEGWTNPYFTRMFGGVTYVSAIFAFLILRKKEWEDIKIIFAYFIGIITSTLIIEISVLSIFGSTFSESFILLGSSTIIIEAVLVVLGIVSYIKQRR